MGFLEISTVVKKYFAFGPGFEKFKKTENLLIDNHYSFSHTLGTIQICVFGISTLHRDGKFQSPYHTTAKTCSC